MQGRAGVIEVTTGVTFIQWGSHFFWKVFVEIDGTANQARWGTNHFEVEPGRHHVRIYISTPLLKEHNAASTDVTVEAGKVTRVRYTHPASGIGAGIIDVEGSVMPAVAGAAAASAAGPAGAPRGTAAALPGATCADCGAELLQGARFCRACGTPVSEPAPARACPSCGNPQSSGRFCANCGGAMEA